jgi:hypothetical protein
MRKRRPSTKRLLGRRLAEELTARELAEASAGSVCETRTRDAFGNWID